MDMTADRRLVSRLVEARPRFQPVVGAYVVVGDEGAVPRVAKIVAIDKAEIIDLEVLEWPVESHSDLLAPA